MVEWGVCNAQIRVRFPVGPLIPKGILCSSKTLFSGEGLYILKSCIGELHQIGSYKTIRWMTWLGLPKKTVASSIMLGRSARSF